jgi:hypothetical protein
MSNSPEQHMQHASGCVGGCVRELVALIAKARDVEEVVLHLRAARSCFLAPLVDHSEPDVAALHSSSAWRWSALEEAARASSWAALATLFGWRELQAFVDTLLSGADRPGRAGAAAPAAAAARPPFGP